MGIIIGKDVKMKNVWEVIELGVVIVLLCIIAIILIPILLVAALLYIIVFLILLGAQVIEDLFKKEEE